MAKMALKHFFSQVLHLHARPSPKPARKPVYPAPTIPLDPFWHGDHWQNLLASPMDARHYVMEDWALPAGEAPDTPLAWPGDSRGRHRSH